MSKKLSLLLCSIIVLSLLLTACKSESKEEGGEAVAAEGDVGGVLIHFKHTQVVPGGGMDRDATGARCDPPLGH